MDCNSKINKKLKGNLFHNNALAAFPITIQHAY
jgi:hypothetical protein